MNAFAQFIGLFFFVVSLCGKDVQFIWDAPTVVTNVSGYRLQLPWTNVVTTNLSVTVTNFPCGSNVVVTLVSLAKTGLDSDSSAPVNVFLNCPPGNFRYQALLESSDDLGQPFQTVSSLGAFDVIADEPRRFYRVRLVPTL